MIVCVFVFVSFWVNTARVGLELLGLTALRYHAGFSLGHPRALPHVTQDRAFQKEKLKCYLFREVPCGLCPALAAINHHHDLIVLGGLLLVWLWSIRTAHCSAVPQPGMPWPAGANEH